MNGDSKAYGGYPMTKQMIGDILNSGRCQWCGKKTFEVICYKCWQYARGRML